MRSAQLVIACAAALLAAQGPSIALAAALTPDGYGRIRIGMTPAQVTRVLPAPLIEGDSENDGDCRMAYAPQWDEGVSFMFEDGRLTRIQVRDASKVTTPRGIGVGATEAEVRKAYGSALEVEPEAYAGPPAMYLTFWTIPGKRGVRFVTNDQKRVDQIYAGGDSIRYIEGCL